MTSPRPPATPKRPVTDIHHGVAVTDDYRWLESAADPEVVAWGADQNAVTRAYLDDLPSLPVLRERIRHLLGDAPRYTPTASAGGRIFAFKYQPPLQQSLLVSIADPDDLATERVVVDPNALDPTGATAIDWFVPSLDGRLVAVSLSVGGSEDGTLHVFEVESGVETSDVIPRVQYGTAGGSVAWLEGSRAIFYTRYPHPGERADADLHFHQEVWRHELGRPVSEDRYVIGREFPRIAEVDLTSSADGGRVLARVAHGDGGDCEFWLWSTDGWHQLSDASQGVVGGMFGSDGAVWLLSLADAPMGRILRLSPDRTDLAEATVVLPEAGESIAEWTVTDSHLYVIYLDGGPSRLDAFDHAGRPVATAATPPVSTVRSLVRTGGDEVVFGSVSFVTPEVFQRWGARAGENRPTAIRMTSPADLSNVTVTREFAVSRDGTRIPMSILRMSGPERDEPAPTLLYGYGGYGVNLAPAFSPVLLAWLEQGGTYAVANIRGGGEFGDAWHRAGHLTRKQNVFDDFIACAERLVGAGYTVSDRLAIMGASNGGLLMGAVLTQRPELFRAVACDVGVLDALRVEHDDNGAFNVTEFGTIEDPAQFEALNAYSPVHRVRDGTAYPAVLLSTGANDPRVDPYHSRKMAARLQAASSSGRPVLLRTTDKAGHGMGSSLDETVSLRADQFAFLLDQLGVGVRRMVGA
jgi:prolyl oligopeptidase